MTVTRCSHDRIREVQLQSIMRRRSGATALADQTLRVVVRFRATVCAREVGQ